MNYKEEYRNLFDLNDKEYIFAHCISSDCAMGAGIAVPMKKHFHLGGMKNIHVDERKHPTCIYYNGCMNLITKKYYYNKPTYNSLTESLNQMKSIIINQNINKIAMPKIGCGIDGLQWPRVREIVKEIFQDLDIEVYVCVQ